MNVSQSILTYTFLFIFSLLIVFMNCLNAVSLNVGNKVDVDLNIFSDKDLGVFNVGIKRDCIFLGKEDNMFVFQYDDDKIIVPMNSIKMIVIKQ